jgi:small conductance mechanosensitive channel
MRQILTQLNLSQTTIEVLLAELTLTWGIKFLKVLLILFLSRLTLRLGNNVINKLFAPGEKTDLNGKRSKTLLALLLSVWRYFIFAFTAMLVLTELNIVEIAPILAGAGIIGLAVGFGAQSLVRDVLSGFFILLEDQFSVGDYITTGSFSGIVEELGLRITKIRDFSGELHIIANGNIETVTNRSRGSMRSLVDVGVAYEEDVDQVISVLEELCQDFARNNADLVEDPTVLGVVALEDSAVVIRIIAQTVPMAQWKLERDLRRAILNEFDKKGIEIPYPRRVLYHVSQGEGYEDG